MTFLTFVRRFYLKKVTKLLDLAYLENQLDNKKHSYENCKYPLFHFLFPVWF